MPTKSKPNEITITRLYEAPVEMVWDAWVDPDKVAKWWGPRGFTLTTISKDVRTGGTWHYIMHGPDGTDYPNLAKYLEVEKHSRMVYDHGGYIDRPPLFRVTVTFKEVGKKTKMEMTMALPTAEAAEQTKKFIKDAGGNGTWDRLAEFLSPVDRFVINRSFDVPREKMFELWTKPEHLSKWLPPTGLTMEYIRADIREGGEAFYCMKSPNGLTMYGKAFYKEITKPERIVYTQIFCDEKENISRHPMAPTWPATMMSTITFSEEEDQMTRVTIQWEVHGDATAEERETFHREKPGMTQGWTGSLDKLEAFIEAKSK